MEKRLLSTLIIVVVAVLGTVASTAQDKWTGIARYAADNEKLLAAPADPARVVLLGNSITDNWPKYRADFFAQHPTLVPRGISGQTSYQMLVRFREDVVNLHPKAVVINCGTNDIAENGGGPYCEDNTMGNIMSMVEIAKANKIKVYLSSVLPSKCMYWASDKTNIQEKIASLNARIQKCAKKQGLPYIDYYTPMVYGEVRELNPKYTTDGVHPTADGYRLVMEPVLLKALRMK